MSVDWFSCDRCGRTVSDHNGYIVECRDVCGRRWCRPYCAQEEGWRENEESIKLSEEDPQCFGAKDHNDFSCNFC